jgi:hypothetical protein
MRIPRGRVLGPAGRAIALDVALGERRKVRLRAVAGIGRGFLGPAPQIGRDGVDERDKLVLIALARRHAVGEDELGVAIGGLRVVALDEAVRGLENTALGVGEMALRLAVGLLASRLRLLARLRAAFRRCRSSASALAFAAGGGFGFGLERRLGLPDLGQRRCLSRTQSGSSSPRLSAPNVASSAASAAASQRATSASSSAFRFVMRSQLIALCREALALILVPSNATCPRLTRPAVSASRKPCTNTAL